MFGGSGGRRSSVKYRGQDFNAELKLNLTEVLEDNKQVLTVNGKNIRLTIPAGVNDNQTIKIAGYGGEGVNGGPKGDLFITFYVSNNTNFKREGANLYLNKDIDLFNAVLGGETIIETLTGKVKFKVPAETDNGSKIKLTGKGMPIYKKKNSFGDLIVSFNVQMPKNLNAEEKELFQKLSKLRSHEH
jgi:curved DNA-binding protein